MTETYTFTTAAELRDWLNNFITTDLDTVYLNHKDNEHITIQYEQRTLTDGSKVTNLNII